MELTDLNLKSKRRMRVVDLDFVFGSQHTLECISNWLIFLGQDLTPLDGFDYPLAPPVGSRDTGESIDTCGI